MPNTELNVLSIDFDFFQVVDKNTLLSCYPDGTDLPTELSAMVWNSHYAHKATEKKLKQVHVNKPLMNQMRQIINRSCDMLLPESMIVNSHRHIHKFIMDYLQDRPFYSSINLVNVDMHHDMTNGSDKLDCGNWISHVKKDAKEQGIETKVTWITNPVSNQVYDNPEKEFDCIQTDFSDIENLKWDLIFLCRSDNWVPPHLDDEFTNLAELIQHRSAECLTENHIMTSRYDKEFRKSVLEVRKFMFSDTCVI